jgi:hypothetical protein
MIYIIFIENSSYSEAGTPIENKRKDTNISLLFISNVYFILQVFFFFYYYCNLGGGGLNGLQNYGFKALSMF